MSWWPTSRYTKYLEQEVVRLRAENKRLLESLELIHKVPHPLEPSAGNVTPRPATVPAPQRKPWSVTAARLEQKVENMMLTDPQGLKLKMQALEALRGGNGHK
jgi:hypothetical protein